MNAPDEFFFFFFRFLGAPNFSDVTHPCLCRHELAQVDKRELSTWRSMSVAFKRPFVHFMTAKA